jgi:hypothetical protein
MSNRDLALPTRGLERSRKASEGGHFRGREREEEEEEDEEEEEPSSSSSISFASL